METLKKINVNELIKKGKVENEFEYKKLSNYALHLDNELDELEEKGEDLNSKTYKQLYNKLNKATEILDKYSKENHIKYDFSDEWLKENEIAEKEAEEERQEMRKRKKILKQLLKEYNLKQQELGYILGYKSKTYISNIVNGLKPLKFKDAFILKMMFHIKLQDLINEEDWLDLINRIENLESKKKNPKLKKIKSELKNELM